MKHLILCPEYPPAPIPPGGIGTYVVHMARLLAEAGESVHIIGRLWEGASKKMEPLYDGNLIIHRVPIDEPVLLPGEKASNWREKEFQGLARWNTLAECFSWQAGRLAEDLVEREQIDIVEAQEFEAPLYFFQLRRALGLGPKTCPPILIHFHSPMEFIYRYNEWETDRPHYISTKRMEDFSIAAADAWVCPSFYLARQVQDRYGLDNGAVAVIPYPMGNSPVSERTPDVWERGTICYIGRLEPRKGVIEWVDAVLAVADDFPSVHFEFVGADLPYTASLSMKTHLLSKIPSRLKSRLHFRGSQPRHKIVQFLAKARIAVVPSRWENFPNTCIEAMRAGLPVIASRTGGMVELLCDGKTGWLADESGSKGLERALRRALSATPTELAAMGKAASEEIHRYCSNHTVLETQMTFRRHLSTQPVTRSLMLSVPHSPFRYKKNIQRTMPAHEAEGIAVVISCLEYSQHLPQCLESIRNQSVPPALVLLVVDGMQRLDMHQYAEHIAGNGWIICEATGSSPSAAKNMAMETIQGHHQMPLGCIFLSPVDQLLPECIGECLAMLQRCTNIGLLSSWMNYQQRDDRLLAYLNPDFPYQLFANEVVPATVFRTQAIVEAGGFRDTLNGGYEMWDLVNAILAGGWAGVTIPALLSKRAVPTGAGLSSFTIDDHHRMYKEVLTRFPDIIAQEPSALMNLIKPFIRPYPPHPAFETKELTRSVLKPSDIFQLPLSSKLKLAGLALLHPHMATSFLLWHSKRAAGRAGRWLANTFTGTRNNIGN